MRNGRGVRVQVIVTGDKGTGDAFLFNSLDIKYVGSWLSSYQVMLIETDPKLGESKGKGKWVEVWFVVGVGGSVEVKGSWSRIRWVTAL